MNFDLEKGQQLAFNRLKKAYADCKKENVLLVNQYGTLHAYNGNLVIDFADDQIKPDGHAVYYTEIKNNIPTNEITNVDSGRADDEGAWMVGLSAEGLQLFEDLS